MPPRLILNADDFGLTPGINRAIAELHAAGALTSATLMAGGPAFDDAIRIAHEHPTLGIGCHIVLTDGTPISPPHTIPTLLGPINEPARKTFRPSLGSFFRDTLLGRIAAADIAREAQAQIDRIQQQGIRLTHIDTHKHTHILPQIARPLLAVAERTGIPAIRNPFEPPWSIALGRSPILRRLQLRRLRHLQERFLALSRIRSGSVRTTSGPRGISATGQLRSGTHHTTSGTSAMSATGDLNPTTLGNILNAMPDGLWELVCHPGYN